MGGLPIYIDDDDDDNCSASCPDFMMILHSGLLLFGGHPLHCNPMSHALVKL